MYTLLCFKQVTNKDLLYSTQGIQLNVIQHPVWKGSLAENGYPETRIYMAESL